MPHTYRFHVPPENLTGALVTLPGDEAHHAAHVVRANPGDAVELFDGQGHECVGTIESMNRREVRVAVGTERFVPPPSVRVTLFQAWLLREKSLEFLIQHGTEIGVSRFVFFRGGHSGRPPQVNDKWQRIAIEACKQCGRSWAPTFAAYPGLAAALDAEPMPLLIATPHREPVPLRQAVQHPETGIIIGPEGDFTDDELALAASRDATPISLGSATYRAEVAAVLAAALVLYELNV